MSAESETPKAGLNFTDNISIDWRPVADYPDDARLALVNESNEAFLRAVSAIGAFAPEPARGRRGHIIQEIAGLDLKINLLLDLVSQLIYKQLDIPERSLVTISSGEISWSSQGARTRAVVFVQVYIQHGTPKPLCFYGKVISTGQEYEAGCARVSFLGLAGSADWLDKLIFPAPPARSHSGSQKSGCLAGCPPII